MIDKISHFLKLTIRATSLLMVLGVIALLAWSWPSSPPVETAAIRQEAQEVQTNDAQNRAIAPYELDEDCIVSMLNRTSKVQADGTWRIPNIPSNFGPVRARATCIKDGVTISGQSDFAVIQRNQRTGFNIVLGDPELIPASLAITATATTLTEVGATSQFTVTATYPDDSTGDITAASDGTGYTSSNPAVATVSEDGLVTALSSGSIVVSILNEGALAMMQIQVSLGGDTDGDGINDDLEVANGLDPNNPVDALEDPDQDGLTNLDELTLHGSDIQNADSDGDGIPDGEEVVAGDDGYVTSPVLADTDGDGLPDNVEIAINSDPTDADDPENLPLESLSITPNAFVLTVNTLSPEASQQLSVIGKLTNGMSVDLTGTTIGTNYSSSDVGICNFGGTSGEVFAGSNGTCTITVTNNGITAQAVANVESFAPTRVTYLNIPGYARNVDVSGNFAYVAADTSGLHVVDVSNRSAPVIVGTVNTPNNAYDVKVVGDLAYVADGASGLQIIDVAIPTAPAIIGSLDTSDARRVVVSGNRAYVADWTAGLRIIDISDTTSPTIVGTVDTPGRALGVDVSQDRQLAVVADYTNGIQVVDLSDETAPTIIGTGNTPQAWGVVIEDDTAFVADYSSSLTSVDISNPQSPQVLDSTPRSTGGLLRDVVLANGFAFGADLFFVNDVPIVKVGDPQNLAPQPLLRFRGWRDDNGTGIAVDDKYVYLTAAKSSSTRLYIGQYFGPQPSDIALSADALDFGNVFVGGSSTQQLTLSNNGQGTLSVTDVSVSGGDFTVDNPGGFNLAPGATQAINVTFAPGSATAMTATVTIASTDPDEPTVTVSLEGEGLVAPELTLSADDFTDTLVAGQSSTQTLTIGNVGGSDLTFDLQSPPAWLSVTPTSGTVAPNGEQSVTLEIDATNLVSNTYSGALNLTTNDPGKLDVTIPVTLTVIYVPDITVNPNALDFGDVFVGTTDTLAVTIENTGQEQLSVTDVSLSGGDLTVDNQGGFQLAPGATQVVNVTFAPSSATAMNETLTITSNDPDESTVTVDLQGQGLPPMLSPSSFNVTLAAGQSSNETLTISNAHNPNTLTFEIEVGTGQFTEQRLSFEPAAYQSRSLQPSKGLARGPKKSAEPFVMTKWVNSSALKVLIVAADDSGAIITGKLLPYANIASVDWYDTRNNTPTLAELSAYDAVLTWTNYDHADPEALGNVLADYVDAGGAVVVSVFSFTNNTGLTGRFVDYSPLLSANTGNRFSDANMVILDATHLTMQNVTAATDYSRDETVLAEGAQLIAKWDDEENFVAVKGKVVAVNGYLGDFYDWTGDMPQIVYNSLLYGARGPFPWLSVTPTSGALAAGRTTTVTLSFDATGLNNQTYQANLLFSSNDPNEPAVTIPITLTVTP
ncbi:MAG: choice-of-anchor D domain-containing protein [Ardenticatenaceae bacterium]